MTKKDFAVLVSNDIRSAQNIGSLFRTVDSLSISKIYLCGISATPPNKDIAKTALGATNTVPWQYMQDCTALIVQLKNEGYVICAIEQSNNSTLLQNFIPDKNKKYVFVLGNEIDGVHQSIIDACDVCIEIPQFGEK